MMNDTNNLLEAVRDVYLAQLLDCSDMLGYEKFPIQSLSNSFLESIDFAAQTLGNK